MKTFQKPSWDSWNDWKERVGRYNSRGNQQFKNINSRSQNWTDPTGPRQVADRSENQNKHVRMK